MGTLLNTYTSGQVCQIAGLTADTLEGWVKRKIACPSVALGKRGGGPGKTNLRLWSLFDLITIRALVAFRRAGMELGSLKRVQQCFASHGASLASATLIVTASEVLLLDTESHVMISTLAQPGQAVLALDVGYLAAEVQAAVNALAA